MKFVKLLFAIPVLSIFVLAGVSFWLYNSLTSAHEHAKAEEYIQIPKGAGQNQIIEILNREGVLSSKVALQIYLRTFARATNLQAGEFQFKSPITALEVLKELESGDVRMTKLVIPEGFTIFDIAERIVEKFPQDPPTDKNAVLQLMTDTSQIRDIAPEAKNLEGYMYPSTYNFAEETHPKEVIKKLVDQFRANWKEEWTAMARQLGRTPQEIVTIASLIETESRFQDERHIVASVIYNRLRKGIPLGIDQTAVYIAKMQNRWDGTIHKSDLEVISPYNTRKFGGVPPGPISSVSESSIRAALEPAQTDYIFYVLNVEKNDGSHNFYASAGEFEKGKALYQKWLQEQRLNQKGK